MMNMRVFTLLLVLTLSACATLDDFRKMSPTERARLVCERKNDIQQLSAEQRQLAGAIQSSQMDLGRGYKVHTQCRPVKVYGPVTTTCKKVGNVTECTEFRPEAYEKRCIETPVSLNPDLERQNIQAWSSAQIQVSQSLQEAWRKCMDFVERLSPEEAFRQYQ
jgi:hypothetical protein